MTHRAERNPAARLAIGHRTVRIARRHVAAPAGALAIGHRTDPTAQRHVAAPAGDEASEVRS